MSELVQEIAYALLSWDWMEVIQTAASMLVAFVAYRALGTWRRQAKAKLQSDFLEQLVDAVHAFINQIHAPVSVLRIVKIAIESHSGLPNLPDKVPNPEAVAFIESNGKHYSAQLLELLEKCEEPRVRIQSLVAKGQTFGFKEYSKCAGACQMLAFQYGRIEAVALVIGSQHMNWQNPKVQETLAKVLSVDPEEIDADLKIHHVNFLQFVQDSYVSVFRNT